MRLATPKQALEIDRRTQAMYALPADLLMEAAGCLAAQQLIRTFPDVGRDASIAVLCGPGHNGGDGMVVARHLTCAGYTRVSVYFIGVNKKTSDLYALQKQRCKEMKIPLFTAKQLPDFSHADLIVDAIFGVGLNRPIDGLFRSVIEATSNARCPIIALDGPSGLDGENGEVLGIAVRATDTLTFGLAKPGFFLSQGPVYCGAVHVLSIGFPPAVVQAVADTHVLVDGRVVMQ